MRCRAPRACRALVAGVLLLGSCGALRAQTGNLPVAALPATDMLYLEVSVNQRPSGLILPFRQAGGALLASVATLRQLGLVADGAGTDEIALDGMAGLSYRIDMGAQALALAVSDALRAPHLADARHRTEAPAPAASPGALFNLDATAELGASPGALLNGEVRLFNERGAFTTSGHLLAGRERKHALRFDSYWQAADPDTLRVLQLGDLVTGALSWSRPLRLGGIQWRKNFALRPDLLTYPTATVNGSALVPSALTLYVNGVQQFSGAVPDGPFVLSQVAGINGAGQASVVTRDALGRATVTALPLYVDTRMLSPGLWDYSVELGALRRNYGLRSFDYGKAPQLSASVRHGVTAALTLEGHVEAGGGLRHAGGGMLAALGGLGVISAHVAASAGAQHGSQAGLGYQYLERRFSIDLHAQRASAGFADLASLSGAPVPRAVRRAVFNAALPGQQNLALSQVVFEPAHARATRVRALSWGVTLARRAFVSVSAFADADRRASRGVVASVAFALGERTSASGAGGRQNGLRQRTLQVLRAPDFGGGFGWNVQAADAGGSHYGQAQLRYLGRAGQLGASVYSNDGRARVLLDASGALVAMDGALAVTRQAGGAFALVSTGVAGIPVTHENRVIGVTGASGHLLVPNLNPYSANRVGIEVGQLAADARVEATARTVAPRSLSGLLVRLPVERYRAASVILRRADGVLLAPGTPLRHRESGGETVVGHDGIAFIDRLGPHNTLEVGVGGARCLAAFDYLAPEGMTQAGMTQAGMTQAGMAPPVIGPLTCSAGSGP